MFGGLIKRFCRDDRGAFAVIFGMIAIVLTAMAGATVDLVTVDQMRNRVQIALDSAALALQPDIYSKEESELMEDALALVKDRVGDNRVTVNMTSTDVSKDIENGRLYLRAHVTVPLAFVALLGINEMETAVASQVTRKNLNIEVAMVLDNSGSMAGTKMTNLKTASKCAVNILFYGSCTPAADATKDLHTMVGIVPFTFFVNVGSSYANASWMDRTGNSISFDNFDSDDNSTTDFAGPLDRIALMESMNNTSWKGCVEARKPPYDIDDTVPNTYDPDTLFTPEFAADELDGRSNSYVNDYGGDCPDQPTWVHTQVKKTCNDDVGSWNQSYYYNNAYCTGGTTNTYVLTYADGTTSTTVTSAPGTVDGHSSPDVTTTYSSVSAGWNKYNNTRVITYKYNLPSRERQERMCKYNNVTPSYSGWSWGPNANCPDAGIQPLTDNPASIASEINAMVAEGGTNIHEGAAWGFRILSPTEPFTEGREYGNATSKVMILMTDGENTYYPSSSSSDMNGTQYYMPYGFAWNNLAHLPNGRLGTLAYDTKTNMQAKMDTKTVDTCTKAKEAGITIYTIGLQPPNNTTINMLKACASETSMAYFPTDPSQLNSVFSKIAEQLAQLRIEK